MKNKINDVEASIKKSQEKYREMMREARDPEAFRSKNPYRFRVTKKYWDEILAPLTGSELKVFLRYRIHTNWETGEALLGLRFIAKKEGLALNTAKQARENLVKKEYLIKTSKASRCFFYKILKI